MFPSQGYHDHLTATGAFANRNLEGFRPLFLLVRQLVIEKFRLTFFFFDSNLNFSGLEGVE